MKTPKIMNEKGPCSQGSLIGSPFQPQNIIVKLRMDKIRRGRTTGRWNRMPRTVMSSGRVLPRIQNAGGTKASKSVNPPNSHQACRVPSSGTPRKKARAKLPRDEKPRNRVTKIDHQGKAPA